MNISGRDTGAGIAILAALLVITTASVSFTSIEFTAPTIPENATTNMNWTHINITSNENLSQAKLEWGNASGYKNYSMDNTSASMANWHYNMTNLTDGLYNHTIWTQNLTQNATDDWTRSAQRFVIVDTEAPYSLYACQSLDIENGSYILAQNVSSAGTCFTISANNVTLDGAGYTINYSQSTTGHAIQTSVEIDYLEIKNLKIVQGSTLSNSYAIHVSGTGNIVNNTIATSGLYAYGIYLSSSINSNITNNAITTFGTGGHGVYLDSSSNSNALNNNTIITANTSAYAAYILSSSDNNIAGGSIIAAQSASYYLQNASINNNFSSTNFTGLRNIKFTDTTSYFNYNNETSGNIWLKTSVLAATDISRTLTNWNSTLIVWNDTNGTAGAIANYTLAGLIADAQYNIYNTSNGNEYSNPYNITTDADGNLESYFTIRLNETTEIKVENGIDITPPSVTFVSPTWANNSQRPETWAFINITLNERGNASILEWDNGTAGNYTMSINGNGRSAGINMTGQNGTIAYRVFVNDSSGNMNTAINRIVTLNFTNYPQFSTPSVSTAQRGATATFSALWADVAGLSGYIFSTNNSGSWQNDSYVSFSGTSNTSSASKTLNSAIGAKISYRFYANNTYNRWNDTGIYSITTTCTPSWAPNSWSACSGGRQNRTYGDENSCGTDTGKPAAETQSCSSSSNDGGDGNGDVPAAVPKKSITLANPNNILTKITVNLKIDAINPALAASKLINNPVADAPEGIVYQYFDISKSNFNNLDIDTATIEFKVDRNWIASNGILSVYLSHYETTWGALITELINSDENYNTYRAQTPGFSYFAIAGETASAPEAPVQEAGPPESGIQNPAGNITSNANEPKPDMQDNTTGIISDKVSYLVIVAGVVAAIIIFMAAIYYARYKKAQKQKIAPPPQQPLIDPELTSEYLNLKNNALENAKTQDLINQLKEMHAGIVSEPVETRPPKQAPHEPQTAIGFADADNSRLADKLKELKNKIEEREKPNQM